MILYGAVVKSVRADMSAAEVSVTLSLDLAQILINRAKLADWQELKSHLTVEIRPPGGEQLPLLAEAPDHAERSDYELMVQGLHPDTLLPLWPIEPSPADARFAAEYEWLRLRSDAPRSWHPRLRHHQRCLCRRLGLSVLAFVFLLVALVLAHLHRRRPRFQAHLDVDDDDGFARPQDFIDHVLLEVLGLFALEL